MGRDTVRTGGVLAFPSEDGNRDIRFIDSDYNTLFTVPDGGHIVRTGLDGRQDVLLCEYIDDCHTRIGGDIYHIRQFAELQEQRSIVYAPEHPREGDVCDSYALYQIEDTRSVEYSFCPYQMAKGKLRRDDYRKVYTGVLAPQVTLEDLFTKHNRDNRPFGQKIRSLSMSDIVVLNRGGTEKAYYVDSIGFQEVKDFLRPRQPKRKRAAPGRKRGGESR